MSKPGTTVMPIPRASGQERFPGLRQLPLADPIKPARPAKSQTASLACRICQKSNVWFYPSQRMAGAFPGKLTVKYRVQNSHLTSL